MMLEAVNARLEKFARDHKAQLRLVKKQEPVAVLAPTPEMVAASPALHAALKAKTLRAAPKFTFEPRLNDKDKTGKTVGVKLSPAVYKRLHAQVKALGLSSTKDGAYLVLQLGLAALEYKA